MLFAQRPRLLDQQPVSHNSIFLGQFLRRHHRIDFQGYADETSKRLHAAIGKGDRIVPCPKCSTEESRREWEQKEAERKQRINARGKTGVRELEPVSDEVVKRDATGI